MLNIETLTPADLSPLGTEDLAALLNQAYAVLGNCPEHSIKRLHVLASIRLITAAMAVRVSRPYPQPRPPAL